MYSCTFSVNGEMNQRTFKAEQDIYNGISLEISMATADIVVKNLKFLMHLNGFNMAEVARRSGLTSRHVKFILDREREPGIETTEKLGNAFGLHGWHMMNPNLEQDAWRSETISKLLDNYSKSSPEGRKLIEDVAAREAIR